MSSGATSVGGIERPGLAARPALQLPVLEVVHVHIARRSGGLGRHGEPLAGVVEAQVADASFRQARRA